ncbi:uncharacterized protein [Salvelinus alpinus]|uniref:uncharacterized protein isoform X1 n=2 Tax=Salvelinus alpinus TaxID=8036 RepID=UPI0039FD49F7
MINFLIFLLKTRQKYQVIFCSVTPLNVCVCVCVCVCRLNMNGPKRTWQQVKIKYKNILQNAVKKNTHRQGTGGGSPKADLTPAEDMALELNKGRPVLEGIPGGKETSIGSSQDATRFIQVSGSTVFLLEPPAQAPDDADPVANRISACLADISVWMTDHHLKLNLGKTELLFLPGKDCPFHDLAITVDNSIVSSSQSAKNLGVILDNTLSFSTNIKAVARSCRFMLYNIRRVRPCLTQEAAQVLIQALVISRLDYCNSLLAGLPACAIKPLQLIQNAAARLVFNLPKFSHVTPLLRSLHWLPVEARIRYKTMVLAYGAVRGTAPQYLQALIRPYTQTRALRSSTSGLLASLPLRKYSSRSAQSKLFAALAPQWWNKLPHDARTAESITTFRRHLKPHLFKEYLG